MCKIICITNRKLCRRSFPEQLKNIAATNPDLVILREKDMSEKDYSELAKESSEICRGCDVPFVVNSFWKTAAEIGIERVQLPLHILRELSPEENDTIDENQKILSVKVFRGELVNYSYVFNQAQINKILIGMKKKINPNSYNS